MKRRIPLFVLGILSAGLPVLAQQKLHPVRGTALNPVLLTADRSAVVVERAFHHRLTLGFPTDDRVAILPDTRMPFMVLWLRIHNTSPNPLNLSTAKFTVTDEEGRTFASIPSDQAFDRMMAASSGDSIGSKTLRSLSLGRAGKNRTAGEVKDDLVRYSLHAGPIPPGGIREGMIYFEAPARKKFTANVVLGDLWSRPIVFSTEK
jgi:hypothetical protein